MYTEENRGKGTKRQDDYLETPIIIFIVIIVTIALQSSSYCVWNAEGNSLFYGEIFSFPYIT